MPAFEVGELFDRLRASGDEHEMGGDAIA